jgi:alpha-2-macroglobulin
MRTQAHEPTSFYRAAALATLLLSACAPTASAAATTGPRVTQFAPHGTVKNVRQVTARFSDPMVPLGDPRAARSPFDVDCAEKGTGRWVDSRNWAYDFARDLPAGIRCTFRLRKGQKTLKGTAVGGTRSFTFSTGGPAILRSEPYQGTDSIEEEQAFVLTLDAEPTETSVLAHAWFRVAGIPNRVGVRLVTGEDRTAILSTFSKGALTEPIAILQARQRFPNDSKVSLVWGKGIAAATGVATERDQVLDFTTRKAFTAQFYCQREHPDADCVPLTSMNVTFSAPVTWQQASQITMTGADGKRWTAELNGDEPPTPDLFVSRVIFKGPFPESASFRVELPANLHDDAGRSLANASEYPITVKTAPLPPLAKFSSRFGIIESKAEPVLPVTLRNLEPEVQGHIGAVTGTLTRVPPERFDEIMPWLRKVNRARRMASVFSSDTPPRNATPGTQPTAVPALPVKPFTLPKPNGAQAFEVVGIPLAAPGLYVVELASPRLGAALLPKKQPMYVPTAALVTNLSVHFKWGDENSLVWVTTLEKAEPVGGAHVTIQNCQGTVVWKGDTDTQGIARVTDIPARDSLPRCEPTYEPTDEKERDDYDDAGQTRSLNALDEGLFITAQTADDLSFVSSGWNQGIEPWRFQLPAESSQGPTLVHTIFDRPLFRAGETVHMKHILRLRSLAGFALVPDADRPSAVTIQHVGSNEKYDLPLAWDAAGSAENTWAIPKEAKLGTYQVVFTRKGGQAWRNQWTAGSFRVEEFRVPLMKGIVRLPAEPQVAVTEVPVDVSVQYLAGGSAADLPVRLRAQIQPGTFRAPDEFEHFTFGKGSVQQGIVRQGISDEEQSPAAKPAVHQREDLTLDAAGAARTTITNLPAAETLRDLRAELEFRDPNGEVQTVSSTVPLWPAQRLAGVKAEEWAGSKDSVQAKVVVVDTARRPVPDAAVRVEVRQRKNYSHRKRLVGGFYAYENIEEIGPVLGTLCEGKTNAAGWFLCTGKPPTDGNLILVASTTDDAGHVSTAHTDIWVSGSGDEWFNVEDSDRIDLLPERPRYEPGDTARFQVRMPFREATALVTSEREGIRDTQVVRLSGKDPVVDVKVTDAYAPNMFISVFVVRGRVGNVQPTAMVDLGKPAFKLGIAEIRVGWRGHELKVTVSSDRAVYHVRERAGVRIAVRTADGKAPPAGSEVAVAAVDEGLLELQPNKSWDLLEAMMGRRGYGVRTATAQMQVVGKRHFGLKAVPQGGGGGRQATRELFDTLLLWQARVTLDADGNAAVEVPLNDSLTSFRIAAIATGGVGHFGTGTTTIRSTQDLMLLSGLAPLVREGDQFPAQFTVRNATDRTMHVTVGGQASGLSAPFAAQTVDLTAGEAKVIGWQVTVPVGLDTLGYDVEARDSGGASDRLHVTEQVRPAVPVRVFQATLTQLDGPITQPVERPADALPGRGGIDVHLAPSLTSGLDGVRDWMRRYPYVCLEQRVSRAVVLGDEGMWHDIAAALPSYMDGDGLLKYFPTMQAGSEVLTAYVLAITNEAGLALPPDVQEKMASGLTKFVNGMILRTPALRTTDLPMRKLAAIDALARAGKAQPAMLGSLTIEPNLWPTSAVLDWWSILQRLPAIPKRDVRRREAEQIIRARLNLQGTTMGFSSTDALWWLMVCPDTDSVRMVLDALPAAAWREDMPRLLRGALGRQLRGHWDCTVTNAWGTLAVRKFAQAFEATPVSGSVSATLGDATRQETWAQPPVDLDIGFPWPDRRAELALTPAGTGAPWATIQARAAIPLKAPLSSGYQITKTITPIEPKTPGVLSRGDVLRVRLEIDAQSDMTWVVVNDPVPAGASHLGTGLARDSQIATQTEDQSEEITPAFQERAFEAYRAYYEFVPKGKFTAEYTIRLNQSGRFELPTTRVEALYAPEMFGELPNTPMEVAP